jgi:hypothetical protein
MKTLRRTAQGISLSADALALFAAMTTATIAGRLTHDTAKRSTGASLYRLARALGQLESAGCLSWLVVSDSTLRYTACDGLRCTHCTAGGAQ